MDDFEDPGRIRQNYQKNTKSRIREGPGKLSKNYTPRGPQSSKIIKKIYRRPNFELILKQIYGRGLRPLPKEGGGLRPPPSFGSIFDEIASKSGPGGTFLTHFDSFLMFSGVPRSRRFLGFPENHIFHHFDHFGTFQTGHPENSKIHDFNHFWTFQIGHPEIPIFHNFDYFSRFPEITEFN